MKTIYVVRSGPKVKFRCPSDERYNDSVVLQGDLALATPEHVVELARHYIVTVKKLSTIMFSVVYLNVVST